MTERNNLEKPAWVCEKRLVVVLLLQNAAGEIIRHEVPFPLYTSKLFHCIQHTPRYQLRHRGRHGEAVVPEGSHWLQRAIRSVWRCPVVGAACPTRCVPF